MAWYDPPEPWAWRRAYIYLRTRLAFEFADDVLEDITKALGRATLADLSSREDAPDHIVWNTGSSVPMLWPNGEDTWQNGLVLGPKLLMDAPDIASAITTTLAEFDDWAILDDKGNFVEAITGGPFSRFFGKAELGKAGRILYTQMFLMWPEESPWANAAAEKIRDRLKHLCLPVFFFKNGQICLIQTTEAGSITLQRCRPLLKGLTAWCVVDSNQGTFSRDGEAEDFWDLLWREE